MPRNISGFDHNRRNATEALSSNRGPGTVSNRHGAVRRVKRSSRYLGVLGSLDHGNAVIQADLEGIIEIIRSEFDPIKDLLPEGLVSKCYLGHPFEVHALDLLGAQILDHYEIGKAMPPDLEPGRSMARHDSYVLVEIYTDRIVGVRADGSVSEVGR